MSKSALFFCIICTALISDMYGQTCCTGGVPMLGGFVTPETSQNEWGIHLTYSYNYNNDLISNNEVIEDSFISRTVSTTLFQVDYALTNKWSISLVLPYIWQTESVRSALQTINYPNRGMGDLAIWGQRRWQKEMIRISVAMGIKAPTGSTNQRDSSTDVLLPFSMQNGSGSWDFGFNLQSSWYLDKSRKFSLEQRLSGKVNTKGKTFEAHSNYRFGHQMQLLTGLSYHFLLHTLITDLYAGVVYQLRTKDAFNGNFANENTGGHWVNVMLGSNIYISPKLHIGLSGMLPVYRKIHGLQLNTTWQFSTSLNYKF